MRDIGQGGDGSQEKGGGGYLTCFFQYTFVSECGENITYVEMLGDTTFPNFTLHLKVTPGKVLFE